MEHKPRPVMRALKEAKLVGVEHKRNEVSGILESANVIMIYNDVPPYLLVALAKFHCVDAIRGIARNSEFWFGLIPQLNYGAVIVDGNVLNECTKLSNGCDVGGGLMTILAKGVFGSATIAPCFAVCADLTEMLRILLVTSNYLAGERAFTHGYFWHLFFLGA